MTAALKGGRGAFLGRFSTAVVGGALGSPPTARGVSTAVAKDRAEKSKMPAGNALEGARIGCVKHFKDSLFEFREHELSAFRDNIALADGRDVPKSRSSGGPSLTCTPACSLQSPCTQ